jgi:hypothetical protein
MIKKMDFLHKFEDVQSYLGMLSNLPGDELVNVVDDANIKTAEHFKIPLGSFDYRVLMAMGTYDEEIETQLTFFHEYLRNTPAFRQWISTLGRSYPE